MMRSLIAYAIFDRLFLKAGDDAIFDRLFLKDADDAIFDRLFLKDRLGTPPSDARDCNGRRACRCDFGCGTGTTLF